MSCTPVLDREARVESIVGMVSDITWEQQTRDNAAATQDLMSAVLENMPVCFVAIDEFFNILRFNATATRSFGHTLEEIIGKPVEMLWPPEKREEYNKTLHDFAASGETFRDTALEAECYALNVAGISFPTHVSFIRLMLLDFPVYGIMLVDLTRAKAAEDKLLTTVRNVERMQKQEALAQLAGNIAHDFNNLLAIILGYSDIIQAQADSLPDIGSMTGEIRKAVKRGAGLTRQVLAYTKHQNLEVKPVNLHEFFAENRIMIQSALTAAVSLSLDLKASTATADLDESQFMQVILNLAVNARDASKGTGEFLISSENVLLEDAFFTARGIKPQAGQYLVLTLRDNGQGIPAGALPKIFDPYFSTKSRDKGTGLGLSVVYGIIKQHNGFVFCQSEIGKGTQFQIYLPLSQNREGEPIIPGETGGTVENKQDNSTRHILVVEDEEALRKLIAAQLATVGYQVTTSENGRRALEFIDSYPGKIDLILSDIMMPEMNGLDMALEAQLMQPDAVFIFMSGYSKELLTSKNAPENYRLLAKPFSQEKLLVEISSALG